MFRVKKIGSPAWTRFELTKEPAHRQPLRVWKHTN